VTNWADRYARELGRRVERLGGLRTRLEVEVIGHLEDAAAGHRERGLSPAEAEERALQDFGAPDVVARQLLDDLGDTIVTMRAAVRRCWYVRLTPSPV
jgi:hypothetical protein